MRLGFFAGPMDREFLRQKANAGSEDGNGGNEVQGTVITLQASPYDRGFGSLECGGLRDDHGQTRELVGGVTITTSSGQKGVWLVGSEQVPLCHRVHSGADGAESEGAGSLWFDPQQVRINLSPGSITASYFEADTWLKVLSSLHRPASVLFCPIPCFHP
jgi:hypothetical protein